MEIKVERLSKTYGKELVLNEVTFTLLSGINYGLLGKNGAGKTTLINSMIDLIKPDGGEIFYDNQLLINHSNAIKLKIGVVSDDVVPIAELTGYQNLLFISKVYNIMGSERVSRIESLLGFLFDDQSDWYKPVKHYSTGMKKKIMLAMAVLHKPDVLFLDEPFSGLDPIAAREISDFIKAYQNGKRIVFISSHDLNYVQQVVSHIMILNDKTILFNDSLYAFTSQGKTMIDDALYSLLVPQEKNTKALTWLKD